MIGEYGEWVASDAVSHHESVIPRAWLLAEQSGVPAIWANHVGSKGSIARVRSCNPMVGNITVADRLSKT